MGRLTFLSFDDLPNKHELKSEYFEGRNMTNRRPRLHSRFLVEMVDVGCLVCLEMMVELFYCPLLITVAMEID
jgi:hypothetical protein